MISQVFFKQQSHMLRKETEISYNVHLLKFKKTSEVHAANKLSKNYNINNNRKQCAEKSTS